MALDELRAAITRHPNPVKVAFLGYDLWFEVMTSGKIWLKPFKKGGLPASEADEKSQVVMKVQVVGKGIVINFDPTLPPDRFRLAP